MNHSVDRAVAGEVPGAIPVASSASSTRHRTLRIAAVAAMAILLVLATWDRASAQENQQAQEQGRIAGRVIDAETARPVQTAEVTVEGQEFSVLTDVDGRYRTPPLDPGTYSVVVSRLGYARTTTDSVVVEPGRTAVVSIPLESSAVEIEGITVEAQRAGNVSTEAGLLRVRRAAQAVTDGISAEQIGRAPDSDASDAIARVTGVSVADDFVVVRGLAERYSNTLLNGAELSSPDPSKRVVPLDIFPASLLESVVTSKTATPDKPGDFAGGSVEIQTKEFPEERIFEVSVSQSWDSEATFRDVGYFPRTTDDFFGLDGRGRELSLEPDVTERFAESLRNEWRPGLRSVPPGLGIGVDFGDQLGDFNNALGYVLSVDYGSSVDYEPNDLFAFVANDQGNRATESFNTATTVTTDWGVVGNVSLRLGPEHRFSLKNLVTRDVEEFVSSGFARDPETRSGFTSELSFDQVRYVTRTFWQSQLSGTHQLGFLLGSTLDWRATYSSATRDEPENRTIVYLQEVGTGLRMPDPSDAGDFWFRFLDDETASGQLDWSFPLSIRREGDSQVRVGGMARRKTRDFDAWLYAFRPPLAGPPDGVEAISLPPQELMAPENLGRNVELVPVSAAGLPYDATDELLAGYAMADVSLFDDLRLVGGARVEQWDLEVTPGQTGSQGGEEDVDRASRSVLDILPSGNATYTLADNFNLRAAFSRTVNRPDPRELSSSPYAAVAGECTSFGNPDLERSDILNGDVRVEWYPSPNELVSVSGFYKHFDRPIVQVVRIASLDCEFFPVNTGSAENIGVEFEFRKNLGMLGEAFEPVSIGGNFTYVEGEVVPDPEIFQDLANLPLQDQSPYLANGNLNYDASDGTFSASVLVNYFDDRVRRYGIFLTSQGGGNGSSQTRTPDVYERGRLTLDGKVRLSLGDHFNVSLSGTNLTNENPVEYQKTVDGEVVVGQSTVGTSLSISVSYRY